MRDNKYTNKISTVERIDPSKRIGSAKGRVCYFTVKAKEGLPGGGWGGTWGPM